MDNFIENDDIFKVNVLNRYMEHHNGFIAGGVFKNVISGQAFKDVDIFFKSEEDFNKCLSHFDDNDLFIKYYENKNAVCFKNIKNNVKVDLVRGKFGTPKEIISDFDFTVTKFAYFKDVSEDSSTYKCIYHKDYFEHLTLKKLVIDDKLVFPISTFERSYRYMKYGFGLCRESKAKLIESLRDADTSNLSMDLYFGFD